MNKKETRLEKWRRLRAEFKFDFNEDAEPVAELHRYREAKARHFKTPEAEREYTSLTPSATVLLRELKREGAKPRRAGRRRKA